MMEIFGYRAPFCLDPIRVRFQKTTIYYPKISGGVHYIDGDEYTEHYTEKEFLKRMSRLANTQITSVRQLAYNEGNVILYIDNAYIEEQRELLEINLDELSVRTRTGLHMLMSHLTVYDEKIKAVKKKVNKFERDGKSLLARFLTIYPEAGLSNVEDNESSTLNISNQIQPEEQEKHDINRQTEKEELKIQSKSFSSVTKKSSDDNEICEYKLYQGATPISNERRETDRNIRNTDSEHRIDTQLHFDNVWNQNNTKYTSSELSIVKANPKTYNTLHEIDENEQFSRDSKSRLLRNQRQTQTTEGDLRDVQMYTILLIDTSASVGPDGMNSIKQFVKNFIKGISDAERRHKVTEALALTVIGQDTRTVTCWTTDYRRLEEACLRLEPFGATPLALGIYMTLSAFDQIDIQGGNHDHHSSTPSRRVILLSDGLPTRHTGDPPQYDNDDSCLRDELDVRLEIAQECVHCLTQTGIPVHCVSLRDNDVAERFLRQFAECTNGSYYTHVSSAWEDLAMSLSVQVHSKKLYDIYRSRNLTRNAIFDLMRMTCTGNDRYLSSLQDALNERIVRESNVDQFGLSLVPRNQLNDRQAENT